MHDKQKIIKIIKGKSEGHYELNKAIHNNFEFDIIVN